MKEKIIDIPAGSAFLSACAQHDRATVQAIRAGDGRYVSPMTWKDGSYIYSLHIPQPETEPMTWDSGEAEDDEDADLQRQRHVLPYINVSDILLETAELLTDEPLSSPIVQQLDVWLSDPMTGVDAAHLAVTPMAAERCGRHLLGLLAAIVERHVLQAQAQAAPGRF